jgi:hypothetical protein
LPNGDDFEILCEPQTGGDVEPLPVATRRDRLPIDVLDDEIRDLTIRDPTIEELGDVRVVERSQDRVPLAPRR